MRKRTLGITFSVWLCTAASGNAASLEEVVRPQGLFQIGEVQQTAALSYDYSGRQTSTGPAMRINRLQEKYSLSNQTSILDPDLVLMTLSGGLVLDQYRASTAHSNGVDYQYGVSGSAFSRKPYPVNFLSSHSTTRVTSAFIPTFSATTDSNQFGIRLLNRMLPLSLRYSRTAIEADGLNQKTRSVNSTFMLQATQEFRDVSASEVSLNFVGSEAGIVGQPMEKARGYNVSLTNTLSLDSERRYALSTSLQAQEALQSSIPQQTLDFSESLTARFGKALTGNANYQYSYHKTVFDQKDQVLRYQNLTAGLNHSLYSSLDTRLSGRYRTSDFLNGEENTAGGAVGFSYRKRLPGESELTLGANFDHQVTDRTVNGELEEPDRVVNNVTHGMEIRLADPGALLAVISVKSTAPDAVATYLEGRDYTVDLAQGTITITETAVMATLVQALHIHFKARITPAKYSTDTRGVTGSLLLFQNRYRISGDLTMQKQHLIEGQAANFSLFDSTTAHLRLAANYEPHTLSLEYGLFDSGANNYFYTEGAWHFSRSFSVSSVSVNVRDRYTWHQGSGNNASFQENSFDAGTSLSRSISTWARAVVSLNYINTSSNGLFRNYLFARADLQGHLNLLQFVLSGQTMWRSASGQFSRDDTIHFEVSRPF